jgi:hypothetical protein
MQIARTFQRWMPVVAVVFAVVALAGCASGRSGCGSATSCDMACAPCRGACGGCGPAAPPSDLPKDPALCMKYCRVWVPPVYRDVPRLTPVCGNPCRTEKLVTETCFRTVCTPGKCYGCTTPERDCEAVAVQVCPGGYRWQEVEGGCWRYCECKPSYKWCKKQVHEDGIDYCMNEPPEYRTEVVKTDRRVCDVVYEPPTYKTTWCKECYTPGHWEWRLEHACDPCPPKECCCEPYTYCIGQTFTNTSTCCGR